jgi:hypothetical protein
MPVIPVTWEEKAGASWVLGQPEHWAKLERPYLKIKITKTKGLEAWPK